MSAQLETTLTLNESSSQLRSEVLAGPGPNGPFRSEADSSRPQRSAVAKALA
jgi:hypothetical protein